MRILKKLIFFAALIFLAHTHAKTLKERWQELGQKIKKGTATAVAPIKAQVKEAATKRYNELVAEQRKRVPLATQAPDIKYHQLAWLAPHNSFASTYPLSGPLQNQFNYYHAQQLFDLEQLLAIGIRFLDLDIYQNSLNTYNKKVLKAFGYKEGEVYLAHGGLGTDRLIRGKLKAPRTLTNALEMIQKFLENNPQEILTLSFENYVDPQTFDHTIRSVPGLEKFILKPQDWNPQTQDGWPTLGWMVKNNKRLIVFTDGPETTLARNISQQLVITTFGTLDVQQLIQGAFRSAPSIEQPKYLFVAVLVPTFPLPIPPQGPFLKQVQYVISHLNEIEKNTNFKKINSSDLRELITGLQEKYKRIPNFIFIDHVQQGDGFKIVDEINRKSISDKTFRDTWFGKFPTPENEIKK